MSEIKRMAGFNEGREECAVVQGRWVVWLGVAVRYAKGVGIAWEVGAWPVDSAVGQAKPGQTERSERCINAKV